LTINLITPAIQGVADISINVNVNEVLTNKANAILTTQKI